MTNVLIGLFGLAALVFALLVVTLRQPMRAALALIAHMISLAALFAAMAVHVAALFQILIYVGAVMVLMIYTIMLLDDHDASYVHMFSRWTLPAITVVAIVTGTLGAVLAVPASRLPASVDPTGEPFSFANFSDTFMARYWFDFELATVLLIITLVAVWTVICERR